MLSLATTDFEGRAAHIRDARSERRTQISTVDISRAYFHAKCTENAYIKIPEEDRQPGDEELCGKLNLWMYGFRGAAVGWEQAYTNILKEN